MNSMGLSLLFNMGCSCSRESVVINGRKYYVKTVLGEGGFSVVSLVQDASSGQWLALKRIVCHSKEDERTAMREVEFYNAFRHPNIVKCVDSALVQQKTPDFAAGHKSEVLMLFPYFKRGTLQDELTMRSKSRDYMSEERILRLFRKMCDGLQVVHSADPTPLAHRDLKPANVLLSDDDVPVWTDFGSMGKARIEIHKSSEARALQDFAAERCTMPYRAPELFNVESHTVLDERVDIWSLGCCLYAMCYFKSPFDSAHERGDSVALAVMSGHIDIPDDSPYSGGLHRLIQCMLEVNILQRPFIETVIAKVDDLTKELEVRV